MSDQSANPSQNKFNASFACKIAYGSLSQAMWQRASEGNLAMSQLMTLAAADAKENLKGNADLGLTPAEKKSLGQIIDAMSHMAAGTDARQAFERYTQFKSIALDRLVAAVLNPDIENLKSTYETLTNIYSEIEANLQQRVDFKIDTRPKGAGPASKKSDWSQTAKQAVATTALTLSGVAAGAFVTDAARRMEDEPPPAPAARSDQPKDELPPPSPRPKPKREATTPDFALPEKELFPAALPGKPEFLPSALPAEPAALTPEAPAPAAPETPAPPAPEAPAPAAPAGPAAEAAAIAPEKPIELLNRSELRKFFEKNYLPSAAMLNDDLLRDGVITEVKGEPGRYALPVDSSIQYVPVAGYAHGIFIVQNTSGVLVCDPLNQSFQQAFVADLKNPTFAALSVNGKPAENSFGEPAGIKIPDITKPMALKSAAPGARPKTRARTDKKAEPPSTPVSVTGVDVHLATYSPDGKTDILATVEKYPKYDMSRMPIGVLNLHVHSGIMLECFAKTFKSQIFDAPEGVGKFHGPVAGTLSNGAPITGHVTFHQATQPPGLELGNYGYVNAAYVYAGEAKEVPGPAGRAEGTVARPQLQALIVAVPAAKVSPDRDSLVGTGLSKIVFGLAAPSPAKPAELAKFNIVTTKEDIELPAPAGGKFEEKTPEVIPLRWMQDAGFEQQHHSVETLIACCTELKGQLKDPDLISNEALARIIIAAENFSAFSAFAATEAPKAYSFAGEEVDLLRLTSTTLPTIVDPLSGEAIPNPARVVTRIVTPLQSSRGLGQTYGEALRTALADLADNARTEALGRDWINPATGRKIPNARDGLEAEVLRQRRLAAENNGLMIPKVEKGKKISALGDGSDVSNIADASPLSSEMQEYVAAVRKSQPEPESHAKRVASARRNGMDEGVKQTIDDMVERAVAKYKPFDPIGFAIEEQRRKAAGEQGPEGGKGGIV